MKRLYYITEEMDFAEHISDELTANGIDAHHIHVLSKNEAGIVTHHLNGPNLLQRVDFIHGATNGLLTGLFIAILVMFIARFVAGTDINTVAQIALLCVFMLFGSWVGGLIGFTHENHHLSRFHEQIEKGRHLIMIDVQIQQEQLVHRIIDYLNEAQFSGEDEHVFL